MSGPADSDPIRLAEHEIEPDSDWLEIGNEFAVVRVRRVRTRNGSRLEIEAPKRALSVFLDATILDALTWQTSESMSAFLETPLEALRLPPRD